MEKKYLKKISIKKKHGPSDLTIKRILNFSMSQKKLNIENIVHKTDK
tara:strand:+ start:12208 stop:12348 length:141 start_codon:yes stop_codon:yes gene_type:complete